MPGNDFCPFLATAGADGATPRRDAVTQGAGRWDAFVQRRLTLASPALR